KSILVPRLAPAWWCWLLAIAPCGRMFPLWSRRPRRAENQARRLVPTPEKRPSHPRAKSARPPDPMQILRLVPNQLPAGSEGVEVTLEGKNFVPGTLVNFGGLAGGAPDVLVVGVPRYVNSTEMRVTVNVLPLALPGGRDVQLRTPKTESVNGKGMLNVQEPPPEKPPAPSPSPSPK